MGTSESKAEDTPINQQSIGLNTAEENKARIGPLNIQGQARIWMIAYEEISELGCSRGLM